MRRSLRPSRRAWCNNPALCKRRALFVSSGAGSDLAEMPEPAVQKDELSRAKQARAKGNLDRLRHLPNSELGSRI